MDYHKTQYLLSLTVVGRGIINKWISEVKRNKLVNCHIWADCRHHLLNSVMSSLASWLHRYLLFNSMLLVAWLTVCHCCKLTHRNIRHWRMLSMFAVVRSSVQLQSRQTWTREVYWTSLTTGWRRRLRRSSVQSHRNPSHDVQHCSTCFHRTAEL